MRICQIVPNIDPGQDGLGDYAYTLALSLTPFDFKTTFIVAGYKHRDRAPEGEATRGPFDVIHLKEGDRDALVSAVSSGFEACIVHTVGFGYDLAGVPMWFAGAMEDIRARGSVPIVSVFHELWYPPQLWKKSMFRWFFDRRCVLRIFRASNAYVTNTRHRFENILRFRDSEKPGLWMPVFSNIGELDVLPEKTPGLAVVFGLSRNRKRIYQALDADPALIKHLGITSIIDIGHAAVIPDSLKGLCDLRGNLGDEEVSAALARAQFGFIHYNPRLLSKSGVFAAYASHGVSTINLGLPKGRAVASEGQDPPVVNVADLGSTAETLARIGPAAFEWYGAHGRAAAGKAIASLVRGEIQKRR